MCFYSYFSQFLCFSFRLDLWPLFQFHCLSLSLSELSVQTVEYMLSKYTSPLSLRLNKLQQRERKSEAVGQEEGRMGARRGDEAWKKVKQHLHVQRLQNYIGAAFRSEPVGGNKSGLSPL